jgi:ABC-2 type transport system permease protein
VQIEKISYADDTTAGKENRVSHEHWRAFPAFDYQPAPLGEALAAAAAAGAVLLAWLAAVGALVWLLCGRLGRAVR